MAYRSVQKTVVLMDSLKALELMMEERLVAQMDLSKASLMESQLAHSLVDVKVHLVLLLVMKMEYL